MDRLDALVDQACRLVRLGDLIPADSILRDVVAQVESNAAGTPDNAAFRCHAWLRQVARAFELSGIPDRRVEAAVEDCNFSQTAPASASAARLGHAVDGLFDEAMNYSARSTPSLERALSYIKANCRLPIDVGLVAKSVGCSPRHLRRMFAELEGEPHTPRSFIRRRRVEHAKELLVNRPSLPLDTVAEECGFSSTQALRRAFEAETAIPPSVYRSRGHESEA